jgi:hypothetical protein
VNLDLDVVLTDVEQPADLPVGKGFGRQQGDQFAVDRVELPDGGQRAVDRLLVDQPAFRVATAGRGILAAPQRLLPALAGRIQGGVSGDRVQQRAIVAVAPVARQAAGKAFLRQVPAR